ncbi:Periplasmic serine protease [Planctomycetales bacterium 10988]|nr:Periplasmic serine protease [Planctomycetales bacterium 10988]
MSTSPFSTGPRGWQPLSDEASSKEQTNRPKATPPEDAELLDAYSQAVIRVVQEVSPAVMGIHGPRNQSQGGAGSGFFITSDGYALTNSHVVNRRKQLTATTFDGDRLDAELIGDDPATDLAVVKVNAGDLPFIELDASENLQVGQLVVAIGDPLGFQGTVSTGIVSSVGRAMRGQDGCLIENVIQHTSPLNPGNSGGPLVDSRSRVVGINTAIIAMAQGIGFAVPASTAARVVSELIAHGKVLRPRLGVVAEVIPFPPGLARSLDLLNDQAVRVVGIEQGSGVDRAGIQEGDLIVEANGRIVSSIDDLHRLLTLFPLGTWLQLTLVRGEQKLNREFLLERPS